MPGDGEDIGSGGVSAQLWLLPNLGMTFLGFAGATGADRGSLTFWLASGCTVMFALLLARDVVLLFRGYRGRKAQREA